MQHRYTLSARRQRGISLFVVIVFVMLSMLLALWASRTSLLNEMVVGNDTDYQRAFEAAQALLQDAELDIRGERADGKACIPSTTNGNLCRRTTTDKIPLETQEVGLLLAELDTQATKCRNALCLKRIGKQDFWNGKSTEAGAITLAQMQVAAATDGVGARYGQFTGAGQGTTDKPANPILQWNYDTPANQGGWYWIEVMPYDAGAGNSGLIPGNKDYLALRMEPNVVYRITAIAYGRRLRSPVTGEQGDQPLTQVVLQQTYARQKLMD
ncbi:hypothetical protein GCM10027082_45340 [Comamonas humi]